MVHRLGVCSQATAGLVGDLSRVGYALQEVRVSRLLQKLVSVRMDELPVALGRRPSNDAS